MNSQELGWKALMLAAESASDLEAREDLYRRALTAAEITFGRDHTNVALTLVSLAECLQEQGKEIHARPIYKRVREILAKHLGQDRPGAG